MVSPPKEEKKYPQKKRTDAVDFYILALPIEAVLPSWHSFASEKKTKTSETNVCDEHGSVIIARTAQGRWGVGGSHSWGIAFCCTYAPSTMSCLIGGHNPQRPQGRAGRQLPSQKNNRGHFSRREGLRGEIPGMAAIVMCSYKVT